VLQVLGAQQVPKGEVAEQVPLDQQEQLGRQGQLVLPDLEEQAEAQVLPAQQDLQDQPDPLAQLVLLVQDQPEQRVPQVQLGQRVPRAPQDLVLQAQLAQLVQQGQQVQRAPLDLRDPQVWVMMVLQDQPDL
jgi:hypothetical protein